MIPAWANPFIGIPYTPRARERSGADCWGLVALVYWERFGVYLPRQTEQPDARWRPVEPEQAREGDVLLFRVVDGPHVAVALSRERMLHTLPGRNSCVERWDGPAWRERLQGMYRRADAQEATPHG